MKDLTDKIRNAPRTPGVYAMKDKDGRILYVGKAKDLRSRVRAYFGGTDGRPMVPFLVARTADIDFIVTATEKEALILENNLIKEHRPRYNVYFRDDKTYFHLKIDLDRPFPRFQLVRRPKPSRAKYFGPVPVQLFGQGDPAVSATPVSPADLPRRGTEGEKAAPASNTKSGAAWPPA